MTTLDKPPPPCTLVIFGAAGDLAQRLLIPALYNLRRTGHLPEDFAVIGVARREWDDDGMRRHLGAALQQFAKDKVVADDWQWLAGRLHFLAGEFADAVVYEALAEWLAKRTGGNCLFYLATPPTEFAVIVHQLVAAGLMRQGTEHWRRVVIEKPFGQTLASAQALNREILGVLEESQVYRIDHYLGKETVQNIMVLRFANGLFEPIWNRDHVDHVQITVSETVDIGQRGRFYEATGALRDMVPNHLCQLLALIAMEPPTCFSAEGLHSEKVKLLDAVRRLGAGDVRANVVRAQYGAGAIEGREVVPYRRADNVAQDSMTETYVAMKLAIDNWRWVGVPFYLRTGKALDRRSTEIAIRFKQAPLALFRDTPVESLAWNDLILRLQPNEGVTLRFNAKIPGPAVRVSGVDMKFNYEDYFAVTHSTGYETLLYGCMVGDESLFPRADSIEAGWRIVQPVLDAWAQERTVVLPVYRAGSQGPIEAEALLARDGRNWSWPFAEGAAQSR
jgi:glucose-6-phosphate 1-dehydrogenase